MKKKVIWGIVIVLIFGLILWFDLPYIKTTKNIISNQKQEYTYLQISISEFSNYDDYYNTFDELEIERIIKKLDDLKLRRTREYPWTEYNIRFMANYSIGERRSYTEWVFDISLGNEKGDNILTISNGGNYKRYSYKILDKDFNIEEFIKELKDEQI